MILKEMKEKGWDGSEDKDQIQWTWSGALFYSIIVITTIGYGHIAPKTTYGKITTIFYAIVGIPLMLLCLSNIGDIMASSFRFLYWRVCCYVCTREPKRNSRNSRGRSSFRSQSGPLSYSQSQMRRSVRNSQRSTDSGFPQGENVQLQHAYSDTDCRYSLVNEHNYGEKRFRRSKFSDRDVVIEDQIHDRRKKRNQRYRNSNNTENESNIEMDYSNTDDEYNNYNINYERNIQNYLTRGQLRAHSLDRRGVYQETPIYCNKYAIKKLELNSKRSKSMPKHVHPQNEDDIFLNDALPLRNLTSDEEFEDIRGKRIDRRREKSRPASSARIMSPMGFAVHRQTRHMTQTRDGSSDDEWEVNGDASSIVRPVPIWLCVFLVISYILGGAYLFASWENWSFLDSAYFCFITLTTIGFGDFVPAQGVKEDSEMSIAFCSLYLLFGIALLAMSFNLVQEEVIANVKSVARRLGILKEEEYDD
ncbi:uncharacterized protein LOC134826909 isoform X2 [Culicoides brevitarsis]|uniref:uncharacterized protein LOC134826909 isoform X2 n=1 Tax=Culicoides brevitarsis TaxID=469753 RepID=UPI00307C0DDB